MSRRFIPLVFLLFSISWTAVSAQDCPALVKKALTKAQTACAIMRGNQACYGYQTLDAQLQEGLSPFAFNGVGDITPVDTIESLHMSALDPVTDQWGVALMRVRADISPDMPNENVTLLAFGEVSIEPDKSDSYQPMQAFALKTGDAESGCTDITENGLIIQTPEGVGRVTLWINDVRVRVGSTVLFEAQPGNELIVSTFEGHAEVEAMGQTQEATAGMRVRVPLDADMNPTGAPTAPEAFDAPGIGLGDFTQVTTSYTDGTVAELIPVSEASGNGNGVGGANGNAALGDCNGDNGQGAANGVCAGQGNSNAGGNCSENANENANCGQGNVNGNNGNPGGNSNGNAGGNGNGNSGGNGNNG
ncbi:MAG: hypothetical protein K8I30_12110 [Anaerolineae bacterium]|nr:hypothetical protein [Anaerolineae bacterium]